MLLRTPCINSAALCTPQHPTITPFMRMHMQQCAPNTARFGSTWFYLRSQEPASTTPPHRMAHSSHLPRPCHAKVHHAFKVSLPARTPALCVGTRGNTAPCASLASTRGTNTGASDVRAPTTSDLLLGCTAPGALDAAGPIAAPCVGCALAAAAAAGSAPVLNPRLGASANSGAAYTCGKHSTHSESGGSTHS